MSTSIDRKGMTTLSGGHLAVDFASGSVPAMLPFFAVKFDLNYTLTAVLMLAALASSSLTQPLFGLWSDRHGALWLLPGGIALAGLGIGAAAIAPSYWMLVVVIFLAGLGIAAFHPEGAKFAVFASGRKRASGMSLFNIGGNTGYALGPIIVTPLVLWLGLGPGGVLASIPVLLGAVALLGVLPYLARLQPDAPAHDVVREGKDDVRAMVILGGVIGLRSVAWFALLTFVPLWIVSLGNSEADGNHLLSLMLLSGAVGTLLLGPLADRFGLRRTLVVAQAILTPDDPRLRARRRRHRSGSARRRRHLRRRNLRSDHGAGPDVPAPACRDGFRALDRPRNGDRGRGGCRARRSCGRGQSRNGADLLRVRSASRGRSLLLSPCTCDRGSGAGCDGPGLRIPSARLTDLRANR